MGFFTLQPRGSLPCGRLLASGTTLALTATAGSISWRREKFMHDVEVVACVDFVGGQHAIFTVNFKDGNRDPQVAGKLESLGLCKTRSYDI